MKALLFCLLPSLPIPSDTVVSTPPEVLPCPQAEPRDWLGRLLDPDLSRLPTEDTAVAELAFQQCRLTWLQGQLAHYPCQADRMTLERLVVDCERSCAIWQAIHESRYCDRTGNLTALEYCIGGGQTKTERLDATGWLERFKQLDPADYASGYAPSPLPWYK